MEVRETEKLCKTCLWLDVLLGDEVCGHVMYQGLCSFPKVDANAYSCEDWEAIHDDGWVKEDKA